MTENEIREFVRSLRNRIEAFVNSGWAIDGLINDYTKSADTIEKLFEEIQQYRAIGTIEEFKALKEKSVEKKPITYTHTHRADCPNCKATVRGIDKPFGDYCSKCGIKLDWSEWREQI